MKKVLIFLAFLSLGFNSFHCFAVTKTYSYMATIGTPFILDPELDYGATTINGVVMNRQEVCSMSGFLNVYDNYPYATTNFTYTVEHYGLGGEIYTIMPLQTGVSTFRVTFKYYHNGSYIEGKEIHYTINIVDVTSISIPERMSLTIGESTVISPVATPSTAQTTYTWNSSNSSIASVDTNGKISAKGVGNTTITCTAQNGVSGECVVTVEPTYIQSIALNETDCELSVGEKFQLETTVLPESATIKELTWSSTNEAVAMVSESGKVIAIGPGVCQIKASSNDGSEKTVSCIVNVKKDEPFGDMNGDGTLSVTDVIMLINKILQQ